VPLRWFRSLCYFFVWATRTEPDFLQEYRSINSKAGSPMMHSLLASPLSKIHVLLVALWHQTMTLLFFPLNNLFMLLIWLKTFFDYWCVVVLIAEMFFSINESPTLP
jgi:hypothetical protein